MSGCFALVSLLAPIAAAAPRPLPELASTALSADVQPGIGGLIGSAGEPGGELNPRFESAWAGFHRTDAPMVRFLAEPPLGEGEGAERMAAQEIRLRELESLLVEVVRSGAGEPGVAALARLGDLYEGQNQWYARAWRPEPGPLFVFQICDGCGEDPPLRQKALQAWKHAVRIGYQLGLHGTAPLAHALAQLRALDPADYPPWVEVLPAWFGLRGWELEP